MPQSSLPKPAPNDATPTGPEATDTDGSGDLSKERQSDKVEKIMDEADRRDAAADARDARADEREQAADLKAFMDTGHNYPGQEERRASSSDRHHSKLDRESAGHDRSELVKDGEPDEGHES